MKLMLDQFYAFLDRPIRMPARFVLVVLSGVLIASLFWPLWRISMEAPQYPKGLWLDIYASKLEAGNDGQHLTEINTLNHYIGMKAIERTDLVELDYLPFAFGLLVLLTLRTAAVGNIRTLVDLAVLTTYIGLFSLARFYYMLWSYGHQLDPKAALKVDPFMPAFFGQKDVANFSTESWPQAGGILVGVFITGVVLLTLWHLIAGRLQAVRKPAAAS
jgi:hypothetical protein